MNSHVIVDNRALVFGHAPEPYDPDKPYISREDTTVEDLMRNIYNTPENYMIPGKSMFTAEDLHKILTQRCVTIVPSKFFCLLLLEQLSKQGLLVTHDNIISNQSS